MSGFLDKILADKIVLEVEDKEELSKLRDGAIILNLSQNGTKGEFNRLKNYLLKINKGLDDSELNDLCIKKDGFDKMVKVSSIKLTLDSYYRLKDIFGVRGLGIYEYKEKSKELVEIVPEKLVSTIKISGDILNYGIN